MTESTHKRTIFFSETEKMRKQKENVEVGEFECLYVYIHRLEEGASAFIAVGLERLNSRIDLFL